MSLAFNFFYFSPHSNFSFYYVVVNINNRMVSDRSIGYQLFFFKKEVSYYPHLIYPLVINLNDTCNEGYSITNASCGYITHRQFLASNWRRMRISIRIKKDKIRNKKENQMTWIITDLDVQRSIQITKYSVIIVCDFNK